MILLSFSEIFRSMERIDNSFIAIERSAAQYTGIVVGCLVLLFGSIGITVLLNYLFPVTPGTQLPETFYLLSRAVAISVTVISIISGLFAYYLAKKSYAKPFLLHKTAIQDLEKAINENKAKETNILEKTFKLLDQMSSWIPTLTPRKSTEAHAYGIAAFLLVAFVSFFSGTWFVGLPVSLLVGVIVWLYFRNEKRKEAELQISEFRTWKKKFEEEKDSFLETL